jgi:predicted nucleic acid-binding protein
VRRADSTVVESQAECLQVIAETFERKWADSLIDRECLLATLQRGERIVLTKEEIIVAARRCKKPNVVDAAGICGEALNWSLLIASD